MLYFILVPVRFYMNLWFTKKFKFSTDSFTLVNLFLNFFLKDCYKNAKFYHVD